MNPSAAASLHSLPIVRATTGGCAPAQDEVAVEEPLEIRLVHSAGGERVTRSVSITMRTPGHDEELAAGFLFAENVLQTPDQVESIHRTGCRSFQQTGSGSTNVVVVEVRPEVELRLQSLERHFYATSSCGVCGKSSLAALEQGLEDRLASFSDDLVLDPTVLHGLPAQLRAAQEVFASTGGLHAAGLFSSEGELRQLREDVGRHNAVDKVLGAEWLAGRAPLRDRVLLVSGRASFELMQKTAAAGVPVLAAVGAPSSLAVQLAERFGVTLIGFLRDNRFNIYTGAHRVAAPSLVPA